MKKVTQEWKEVWVPELKNTWKDLKCPKSFYKQIPNLLTASRLLSPIFIIPTILYSNLFVTFIVITFFAFTDFLDGQIARRCNIKSKLGAMLDPVTDKVFALTLLLPNMVKFPIITFILLVLEFIIGFINTVSTLKGNGAKSNLLGKIKTTFLSITAIAMYLNEIQIIKIILPFLSIFTIILQILAAITYKKIDNVKEKNKNTNLKEIIQN